MRLAVNIDHFATLRNARHAKEPDPVLAASFAELAGAVGIVCHLREDRRHIKDDDVWRLRQTVTTKLDLEMAATKEMCNIAIDIKPDIVTLVPERREELTTEGGLNLIEHTASIEQVVSSLRKHNIVTSAFIDPNETAFLAAKKIGFDMVELHTGEYAQTNLHSKEQHEKFLVIQNIALLASEAGLRVVAGHGLNYHNISAIATIKEIEEVSIGHAIVARASFVGITQAVSEMVSLIR